MSWEVWTMPSERTFFNTAVFRRALSRFWLLGAAYTAVLCFFVLSAGRYLDSIVKDNADFICFTLLNTLTRRMIVASAVAAIVMAVAVHGWMFRKTSAAYIAALPVTREALLISSMTAGLLLLAVPCVIMALASLLLYGGIMPDGAALLLQSALTVLLMNIAFFGIASFCTAFTGNIAVLPAIYVILLYGFLGVEVGCRYIAEFLLFGVKGSGWTLAVLSPVYYFSNSFAQTYSQALTVAAVYAAAGVIFAGLAVIFFRRRRMETAGEVVAIPALRPLFRVALALAVSLGAALLLLKSVFNYSGNYFAGSPGGNPMQVALLLLTMLLGAAVGWFGAEALMRKTLRVFDRHWKGLGVLCAVMCVIVVGGDLDLLGIERYQPDADEIGYARVNGWAYYDDALITQPDNIRALLSLQSDIVSHKADYEKTAGGGNASFPLTICYYGKDGALLYRRVYTYQADDFGNYVTGGSYTIGNPASDAIRQDLLAYEAILNSSEVMTQRMGYALATSNSTIISASVQWYDEIWERSTKQLVLTADEFWELYNTCIIPDWKDGTLGTVKLLPDEEYYDTTEAVYIYANGVGGVVYGQYSYIDRTFRPLSTSVRTNEWLRAHGVSVKTLTELHVTSTPETTGMGYASAEPEYAYG